MPSTPDGWWRSGVLYQIYPRSFADTDGDGHGDLQGVIDHLDHLAWLGVDGIWLNPIHPSPNADWGYDVADYTTAAQDLGDLETLDRLVAVAGSLGIRVILDLVPNHTSDEHPWFVDARSDRDARHRDWYVWADPGPEGGPPNNWLSVFGGPAWTWDDASRQFYLHNFLAAQPDLNWWNDDVRAEFDRILRFWFDRGIAGFRIDVAHGIIKDRSLRDNPASTEQDIASVRRAGQRAVFNQNRPEVHDVLRRWRSVADEYEPGRMLMGETWVFDLPALMRFYGPDADELHLAQNFPFLFAELGEGMREVVEATEALMPAEAWPVWAGSNHDAGRFPTRWCAGDGSKVRAALLVLLSLRGTPILYYGDELGMPEVAVPLDRMLDSVGLRGWPEEPGRDRARTPMPWARGTEGGFTRPGVEPWLPLGDTSSLNVADQRSDPGSVLRLCRDLIALRRERPDMMNGSYSSVAVEPGLWAWRRGSRTVVAVNVSDEPTQMEIAGGEVLIGTRRDRAGERVADRLSLAPWEGVVVDVPPDGPQAVRS